jgi:hypothetical protein
MTTITMQTFHQELHQSPHLHNPRMQDLAKLTQANLADMAAFKSELGWVSWDEGASQSPIL